MSFEQISDILFEIQKSHETVRRYCNEHQFDFGEHQKRLLVATLEEDQERIEAAVEHLRKNPSNREAVEVWVQYVPQEPLDAMVTHIVNLKSPTFEELVESISKFYVALGAFIQRIREQAATEDTSNVLDDLAFLEDQQAKALSTRLDGLKDY